MRVNIRVDCADDLGSAAFVERRFGTDMLTLRGLSRDDTCRSAAKVDTGLEWPLVPDDRAEWN